MTATHGRWYVREDAGMLALLRPSGTASFSILAGDVIGEDWINWFADYLNDDYMRPWPQDGLRMYDTAERGVIFVYDGTPVGFVSFHDFEWLWMPVGPDGEDLGIGHASTEYIQVDPEMHDRFMRERVEIARRSEAVRNALSAEFQGRVRYHRDDTRDLALMYGRMKALARGRNRRERQS